MKTKEKNSGLKIFWTIFYILIFAIGILVLILMIIDVINDKNTDKIKVQNVKIVHECKNISYYDWIFHNSNYSPKTISINKNFTLAGLEEISIDKIYDIAVGNEYQNKDKEDTLVDLYYYSTWYNEAEYFSQYIENMYGDGLWYYILDTQVIGNDARYFEGTVKNLRYDKNNIIVKFELKEEGFVKFTEEVCSDVEYPIEEELK